MLKKIICGLFLVGILTAQGAVMRAVSEYGNTNFLASNQLFLVTAGATNQNISAGQLRSWLMRGPRMTNNFGLLTTWATTNVNASNTYGGVVTIPTGYGTISITNNLIHTNSIVVATIDTPFCATNLTATATANLLTLTVSSGAKTNCLVRWLLLSDVYAP